MLQKKLIKEYDISGRAYAPTIKYEHSDLVDDSQFFYHNTPIFTLCT